MSWKKIADSNDLIVFENQAKKHKIKIEARRKDYGWEVFKTKINGETADLISEHLTDNKKQVLQLINKLKSDKNLNTKKRQLTTSLKRIYKEDFIEKWHFFVNNEAIKNVMMVKFDTNLIVDVIMHEKYLLNESSILKQISEKLGLDEFGESANYDIFYYKKHSSTKKGNKKPSYMVDMMDVEFDFGEDEYY